MKWPKHLTVKRVRNGKGIVATKAFRTNARVCVIEGRIVTAEEVWDMWDDEPRRAENCFRFDADNYLDPHGLIGAFANHSCSPNAGVYKVRGKLVLRALRPIGKGEEVTHDYSTLLGSDDVWKLKCNCGERECRKIVANWESLPPAVTSRYLLLGAIPRYVTATNEAIKVGRSFLKRYEGALNLLAK